MKRLIAVLILMALSLTACARSRGPASVAPDAPPDNVPDIIGEYALNGVDFYNQPYGGRLTIQPGRVAGEYRLIWIVTGYIQEGIGRLEGNQLLVEWKTIQGPLPDLHGTARYTITINGELYGTRQAEGLERASQETAYPNAQP